MSVLRLIQVKIPMQTRAKTHWKPVADSLANTPIGNTIGSMLTIQVGVFLDNFSSQNALNKKDMRALTFEFSSGIL